MAAGPAECPAQIPNYLYPTFGDDDGGVGGGDGGVVGAVGAAGEVDVELEDAVAKVEAPVPLQLTKNPIQHVAWKTKLKILITII